LCRSGPERVTWNKFRTEYEQKVVSKHERSTQEQIRIGLDHFERIARPVRVGTITRKTIDNYIVQRRKERGRKKGSTVSPSII